MQRLNGRLCDPRLIGPFYGPAVVRVPLTIIGTPNPTATMGVAYSFTPNAAGGLRPYNFSLTGTLPAGLVFDNAIGAITGTPTTDGVSSGLDITVTDANDLTASLGDFSITVSTFVGPGRGEPLGLLLTLLKAA